MYFNNYKVKTLKVEFVVEHTKTKVTNVAKMAIKTFAIFALNFIQFKKIKNKTENKIKNSKKLKN